MAAKGKGGEGGDKTIGELLSRLRARRRAILKALPPELFAELRKIILAIRAIKELEEDTQEQKNQQGSRSRARGGRRRAFAFFPSGCRVPLSDHKKRLIDFLSKHGEVRRSVIIAETGIPPGSLSELLSGEEFDQPRRGFWALKGQVKKTGTSGPSAQ